MQDQFETRVLAFTLRYEGGKVDDPRDPGGRTNQGITQNTYAAHRKAMGLPAADVFAMTAAERDAIYRTGFWDAIGGAALPAGVDLVCFDFAVNSGPARALAALRRAGGIETAMKQPAATVKAVCAARLSFLHALGTFRTFGRGWTARVAACEALGVTMALRAGECGPATGSPIESAAAVLAREAGRAARAASRHRTVARATGAAAAGVAAAGLALGAAGHAALMSTAAASCTALALLTAAFLWRGSQKAALSAAYATPGG